MRSRFPFVAVLAILTLAGAACGTQPTPAFVVSSTPVPGYGGNATEAIPATGATATLAAPPTSMPPATSASPATQTSPSSSGTSAAPATGTSLVTVTMNLKYGSILADGSGRTLYLFTKDTPNTPSCYGQCAATWPPFVASSGSPGVGTGLDPTKVGTALRTDGTTQVTYKGRPLYYYAQDQKPGVASGQGVGGVWYVVSPEGDPVKQ